MTIKASSYPTTRPNLDLNFAQTKRLDPRITFSRASTGTYVDANGVIQSAASGVARFDHNPSTGESLGLLVEESRTNSLSYSQQISTANWSYYNDDGDYISLVPNYALAPDGSFTASLLIAGIDNGANGLAIRSPALSFSPNNTVATYDLTAGTASPTFNSPSVGIQACSNGWYRCWFVKDNYTYSVYAKPAGLSVIRLQSYLQRLNIAVAGTNGNTTNGVLVWAAQVEAGSFPTSYIPTPATFTSRASTATFYDANGVIQTANTNVARSAAFFPDSNGVMRPAGLLLEAAGTNLLLRSAEISNTTVWDGNYKLNWSADATTAPDGTTTADKAIPNTENVSHSTTQNPAGTISGTYTFSLYAKASGYNKIVLWIDGASAGGLFGSGSATFDLSTKAITSINGSAAIETLSNGWYRCSVTGTSASAVTVSTGFAVYDNSGNSVFTGNGTDGIFVWGAQLEASPYPTSYIPTTTATVTRSADVSSSATVTRSADVAQITGTNFSSWYNQGQGTIGIQVSNAKEDTYCSALSSSVSGSPDFLAFYRLNDNQWRIYNTNQVTFSAIGGIASSAIAYSVSGSSRSASAAWNGSLVSSIPADASDLPFTILQIGTGPKTAGQCNGTISRLTYWPTRLSDATLQAITR